MYIADCDLGTEPEWRAFLASHRFGELIAAGRGRDVPVVVPTQFVVDGDDVLVHLVGRNPVWDAIGENPRVLLAVSGDWAFVPSDWKVIGDEDPSRGIPTTYYASVQLAGQATVVDDPDAIAAVLRAQLAALQPEIATVDPLEHGARLRAIRGVRIRIDQVRAKFKYGGNVDDAHRRAVLDRLVVRDGPGDRAAAGHLRRRSGFRGTGGKAQ
ncbi:MAG: FMN-binding negative transcriptional regulator [Acidimicrobiia bacterium]